MLRFTVQGLCIYFFKEEVLVLIPETGGRFKREMPQVRVHLANQSLGKSVFIILDKVVPVFNSDEIYWVRNCKHSKTRFLRARIFNWWAIGS